jgi:protein O-GlcNAc transferase
MRALPSSRLVLLAQAESGRDFCRATMRELRVEPERLEFVGFQPRQRYLSTYQRIDVGLDSFPYNGHTTSLDSFWMGVPVVTFEGDTVAGRAGVCMARNLGLQQLIAPSAAAYAQTVLELVSDLPRLQELRRGLRARMEASPLMDAPRFTTNLEGSFRTIWREWCARQQGGV